MKLMNDLCYQICRLNDEIIVYYLHYNFTDTTVQRTNISTFEENNVTYTKGLGHSLVDNDFKDFKILEYYD